MTIKQIIDYNSVKRLEKRNVILEGIINRNFHFLSVSSACSLLPERKISLLLETIEDINRLKEFLWKKNYLNLSKKYILSSDSSCKREVSRIVENLATDFSEKLDHAITALLQNAEHDGTVIRWASAYALPRIVVIPQHAKGPLFEQISNLYGKEKEPGVKNQ